MVDSSLTEAESAELTTIDHPLLAVGKRSDRPVEVNRVTSTIYFMVDVTWSDSFMVSSKPVHLPIRAA